jgi:transposase
MSEFDLEARPIYHQKEDAIRSHVLICFVVLIIEKYVGINHKNVPEKYKAFSVEHY